jgi:hypothetical protein
MKHAQDIRIGKTNIKSMWDFDHTMDGGNKPNATSLPYCFLQQISMGSLPSMLVGKGALTVVTICILMQMKGEGKGEEAQNSINLPITNHHSK